MYFMSEFCFVCLGISKSLTDLLKSTSETKSTIDKLHSCVSEIEWNKSQQLLICDQCIIRLNIAYEFKKQCIRSHEAIQKCIQTQRLYSGIQEQEIKDPVNKNVKVPIPNLHIKNGQITNVAPLKIMPKNEVYPAAYTNIIVANSQTKSFQNVFLNLIPTSMLNIATTASSSISQSGAITAKPILQIPQLSAFKAKEKKKVEEKKADVDVARILNQSKSEELSVEVDPLVFDTQENVASNQIDDWEDIISTQIVSQKNENPVAVAPKAANVSAELTYDDKMDFFNSGHFLFQESSADDNVLTCVFCEACGTRFGDLKSLRTHIRTNHDGEFPHKCPFCLEEFAVKKHFESHVRKHEMEQVLTLKDFTEDAQDQSVNKSADSSDDTPLYECLPCDRVFNTEQGLTLHNARRHKESQSKDKKNHFVKGKKSAQCDICQRMFSTHSYLIQHKKLHERGMQRRGRAPNKEQVEVEELISRMGEQEDMLSKLISKEQEGNTSGSNTFAASFLEMIKNNAALSIKNTGDKIKESPLRKSIPAIKNVVAQPAEDTQIEDDDDEDDYADISFECDVGISDGEDEPESEPISIEPQIDIKEPEARISDDDESVLQSTPLVTILKKRKVEAGGEMDIDFQAMTPSSTKDETDNTDLIPPTKLKRKRAKSNKASKPDTINDQSAEPETETIEPVLTIPKPPKVESSQNGAEIEETRTKDTDDEPIHNSEHEVTKLEQEEEDENQEDEDGESDDRYKYVCVDGKPQCSYCKKLFGRKHDLRRHLNNVHIKSVQYVCHVCQKVFYEGFHLTRHLRSHFCFLYCAECAKIFIYVVPDFKNHLATAHQNDGSGVCGICQTTFTDIDTFKVHMDVHFKAMVYACHHCASEFRDCRDLSKHLAEHLGPVRCATCRKTFATEAERTRHQVRRHHGVPRKVDRVRIQCEYCPNTYLKRRYLRAHQKNVHEKDRVSDVKVVEREEERGVSEEVEDSEPMDLSAKGCV